MVLHLPSRSLVLTTFGISKVPNPPLIQPLGVNFHCSELLSAAPAGNRTPYTPPKNPFPTTANQMNFNTPELNIIGHWSSSSKMPERYDRAVCANELPMRNTIIQKVVSGWELAPLAPLTADCPDRPPHRKMNRVVTHAPYCDSSVGDIHRC